VTKEEVIAWALALGLPTLIQVSPLKVNPWSWIGEMFKMLWRCVCQSLNADVLKKLSEIEKTQKATKEKLENHIKLDDEREADKVRASILHFNNELLRGIPHTKEEFVEILAKIDWYNGFCKTHEDYLNSRAVHAIANIERSYDERLKKRDFLQE
jgi:hypothetical protein